MIGGRRPIAGRKIADRRVRVERPHAPYFRYSGPGQLVAREAASERPKTATGRFLARLKNVALGRPLANEEEIGERLSKKKALAIFSSDAISSSAYATEEILKVLIAVAAGAALAYSVGISIAIAGLLAVVSVSYRQVCRAYPSGGGAYVVARDNLSQLLGLIGPGDAERPGFLHRQRGEEIRYVSRDGVLDAHRDGMLRVPDGQPLRQQRRNENDPDTLLGGSAEAHEEADRPCWKIGQGVRVIQRDGREGRQHLLPERTRQERSIRLRQRL